MAWVLERDWVYIAVSALFIRASVTMADDFKPGIGTAFRKMEKRSADSAVACQLPAALGTVQL